ncbi:hypothetical protein [Kribbella solani]|uniref:Uncharacterized protein n=1 Tax=Kribbella solani TaxID=236067 RepID=A0A841DXT4_9ACTN|nr:hypothetical protein [Kribbella solani]MBB5983994.1 hypothetical protein [Kribbella solani]
MTSIPSGNQCEVEVGLEIFMELEREIRAVGGTACKRWMREYTSPVLADARGITLAAELIEACSWCPIVGSCALLADQLPESQRGGMVIGGQLFNKAGERVMIGAAAAAIVGVQPDEKPDNETPDEQLHEALADDGAGVVEVAA